MALFRRRREEPPPPPADPLAAIDRSRVPPQLQPVVDRAVQAVHRYRGLVAARPAGPVRDRLAALGPRVEAGVLAVVDAAVRAGHVDAVAVALDPDAVTAAYKDVRRRADAPPELVESHRARFESVQRILNSREETRGRLEVIEARLEATVARAAELALVPGGDLGAVEADLADLSSELAALRAGLDELGGAATA